MKRSSEIMTEKYFYSDDDIDEVSGWPESFRLHSCLGEVDPPSKLQGQYLVNGFDYRNRLSRLQIPKEDFINKTFQDRRLKFKVTGLLSDLGT